MFIRLSRKGECGVMKDSETKKAIKQDAARIAALLTDSDYPICITGAGVSTDSGIPDFRSPETGLWNQEEAKELSKPGAFRISELTLDEKMELFWRVGYKLGKKIMKAKPNKAHKILADWEKDGIMKSIITQNVDRLHQKAGSQNVIEIHGNAFEAKCMFCGGSYRLKDVMRRYKRKKRAPWCDVCAGFIRPNVVMFGESTPSETIQEALVEIKQADLALVLGSSLIVYPANYLPVIVRKRGGKLVIINDQSTDLDKVSEVVVNASITRVMKEINKALN